MVESAVKKIHSDNAERFLLIDIRLIEHPDVDDNLARFAARLLLKTHAQPAVRFVVLLEAASRDGVGKDKKRSVVSKFFIQPFDQQIVLVVQHRLEPVATDIAVGCSVNGVAKRHVVGRYSFGDCSRSAPDMEKSSSDLLAGADLGEGPVLLRVEIDLERLLIGADIHLRVHTQSRCGQLGASQPRTKAPRRDYIRTRCAPFAGIQPRRSFGNAA